MVKETDKKAVENRADLEIANDILHALAAAGIFPCDRVRVSVHDGFVTLEGTTHGQYQRDAAESCARNVTRVRGVANRIGVRPEILREEVEEALRRSAEVDAQRMTKHYTIDSKTLARLGASASG